MLEVLQQSESLRAYNKPANISLLRDRSGAENLWQTLQATGDKPYLVHRLDKGTSGVLLVARTQAAQTDLTRAFQAQAVSKFYLAWVVGHFTCGLTHHIDLPLCKGRKSRYRVAGNRSDIEKNGTGFSVTQDRQGVAATTWARGLLQTESHTLMLLKPLTGRTHQIRVHLSWLGFPIVGDHLYGKATDPNQIASRLMLHCHRLAVPGWGAFMAPLPSSFTLASESSDGGSPVRVPALR
jgi:tRNA pseudouridine32 synthase/23S rRNA pseudouridine746 synthase